MAVPFTEYLAGATTNSGNKCVRTGQFDPGWDYGVGTMWPFAPHVVPGRRLLHRPATDGATWTTLKAATGCTFDPATGNPVTVTVPTTPVRYPRLNVTADTGWPAAQLSELQIFS
ncbi:hypothetical protein [Actinacidiphila sp. ITFR-21]|uniref:hypothetical protein n=1 Tax=Actinacidiphila sp. ITFR-21 TaxID=3075199 RepID=UPI00288BA935|nr:hypothetical protein [Streptomyces sp. ITFR-21]WNI18991.1 hypothetical protein RLT57_27960 [Streptomyces sp. ITFR-21]